MTRYDGDDVIVTRTFTRDDGEVLLLIHKPEPAPKPGVDADLQDPPWRCHYTIRFPSGQVRYRSSMGIDGMQAMLLAIAGARGVLRNVGNGTPEKLPAIHFLGDDELGLQIPQFD